MRSGAADYGAGPEDIERASRQENAAQGSSCGNADDAEVANAGRDVARADVGQGAGQGDRGPSEAKDAYPGAGRNPERDGGPDVDHDADQDGGRNADQDGGRNADRGREPAADRERAERGATEDEPDAAHQRPDGLDDVTVQALGKLSEALETVERVRGHLYSAHQLVGTADFALDEAVSLFMQAGHTELAERVQRELIGRNVIPGHWTFQIVEEFDDGYYAEFRGVEREAREQLAGGRRHLYEAELKERRRTHGRRGHEARPVDPERHTG